MPLLRCVALLSGLAPLALAQDTPPTPDDPTPGEAGQEDAPPQEGEALPESLFPEDPLRQEMVRLFHDVERALNAIDVKLSDAGAGEVALAEVADAGIDRLLRDTGSQSNSVVRDIDRILEIARELGSSSMSGMNPKPSNQPSSGDSPLDEKRDQGPSQREQTPSEPHQEQPDEPKPGEAQEPNSPLDDKSPGENRSGQDQEHPVGAEHDAADDGRRWGHLPVRFRETFRSQGGKEMPVQYRDWIDAYYRRLQSQRPR